MKNSVALLCMLPKELCSEVIDWGKKNIKDNVLSNIKNKGRENGPHITLAHGIIDEEPHKAIEMLSEVEPFDVELGQVSHFRKPDRGYDVVKVEVASPTLHSLNSNLLQNLEVKDPITPYNPHVTIAYVAQNSCDGLIGNSSFLGKRAPIQSVVYADRSNGGRIIHLKSKDMLKDSLDYGIKASKLIYSIEEIEAYLSEHNISIKTLSAEDIGRAIVRLSNISL